tara:strand:+ start:90 stop:548 length:459 start_codon:yes stop_codon:yes gene_type:complete
MKKLSLYVFLFLMLCSNVFADNLRIIDGDTIELNGERIRFSGIDTPEPKQICTLDNIEIFCGNLASIVLKEKIGNEIVSCEREPEKDFFGRTLGECFINDESLSKFLVRNGYAFAFIKYSKKFVEDEKYAKKNNLGLWAMEFEFPWDFRKKK